MHSFDIVKGDFNACFIWFLNVVSLFYRVGIVNGRRVFLDCENVSITSPRVYMCLCCPYVTYIDTTRNDCTCTRIGW